MPGYVRWIVVPTLLLAAFWAAWWGAGWLTLTRALPDWAEARRAEGWQVDWTDARVSGFPSRFDTTLTEPALADPRTGWAWSAPFFQVFALSYRPSHLIAVWPPSQTLSTPLARYTLWSDSMKASLRVTPDARMELQRSALEIEGLILQGPGWQAGAAKLLLATGTPAAPDAALPHALDLGFIADGLRPSAALKDQLDPAGILPSTLETLRLDAVVGFDAPWDRAALEQRRPQPRALRLTEARATWGGLDLRLAGALDIAPGGLATGRITVKATNWREILTLAQNAGLMPAGLRSTFESGLESLAALSGRQDTLDIPLTINEGRISLGLVPLGVLPPLVLR